VQDESGSFSAAGLSPSPSGSITPTQHEDDVLHEASGEITQEAQPAELDERLRQLQAARELLDAHEQNQIAAEENKLAEAATLQQRRNNAAVREEAATNAAVRDESNGLQAVELADQAHDKPNFLTTKLLAKITADKELKHEENAQAEANATKAMENTNELKRLDLQREEEERQATKLAEAEREYRNQAEAAQLQRENERMSQAGGEPVRQTAEREEPAEAARLDETKKLGHLEAPQGEEQVRQTNELADEEDQTEAGATKLDEEDQAKAVETKLEKEFFATKFVASLANITVPDQQEDYDDHPGGMMHAVIAICMDDAGGRADEQALKVAIAHTDMQLIKAENDLEVAQRLQVASFINVASDLVTVLNLAAPNLRFDVFVVI
jgi:hypothetical protein